MSKITTKAEETVHLTDSTFQPEVLESERPVLVDFWAGWCAPCRALAPLIQELADRNEGKVKFAKLDVDSNLETAREYGISSIPSVLIFRGGEVVERLVGLQSKQAYQEALDKVSAQG